jgi:uncharacterized protein (UPF0335 family)
MSLKNSVSGEELRSYVERLERIDQEKKELSADRAVVMAEIKAAGFDTKIVAYVLKARAASPSELQEDRALKDLYLSALGLTPEPPLFRAMGLIEVDTAMRESVIEAWKRMVEPGGSVTITPKEGRPFTISRDVSGTVTVSDVIERKPAPVDAPRTKPARQAAAVPEVDAIGAEMMGYDAAKADQPVISNPFPFGDARRARWDEGWRRGAGSDGMGPDD